VLCPVCSTVHPGGPNRCPQLDIPVPALLEVVLGARRLSAKEVLKLGLVVCNYWRKHDVVLSDIRPRNLMLGYDGAVIFAHRGGEPPEDVHVGLRALGGVLARCLDRTDPDAVPVGQFLLELAATPPQTPLTLVRAELMRRLDGRAAGDMLDERTLTEDVTSESLPVSAVPTPQPEDLTAPTHAPVSLSPPTHAADPYADTYIRRREDLLPDASAAPTVQVLAKTINEAMPSVVAPMPGPAAEVLPTEVRLRPVEAPPPRRSPWVAVAMGAVGALVAFALAWRLAG